MPKYEVYGKLELDVYMHITAASLKEAEKIAEDKYRYHGQICQSKNDYVLFPNKHKLYLENKGNYITWYGGDEVE